MDKKKFITSYFLEAARNTNFHHKWMTVDTWAELIAAHYQLAKDLIFSGSDLVEAVRRTQWLENLIQGGGLVKVDLTLYRNSYRPKGAKKPIHCFLAAGKDEKPTGENATKNWINTITTDLIEKRLTRSSILTVENEIKVENPGATGKRKMPQAQKTDTLDAKCLTSLEIDPCDHSRRNWLSSRCPSTPGILNLYLLGITRSPKIVSTKRR